MGEHERGRRGVLRHSSGALAGEVDAARSVAVFLESGFAEEEVGVLRRCDEVVALIAVARIRDDPAGRIRDPQSIGLDGVVDEE